MTLKLGHMKNACYSVQSAYRLLKEIQSVNGDYKEGPDQWEKAYGGNICGKCKFHLRLEFSGGELFMTYYK
jgi:hypothetical protein